MGLTVSGYARHRGVSYVTVWRGIKTGRVPAEPDGTIDPAKADVAWARNTDPTKVRKRGPKPRAGTFVEARTDRELAMAHFTQLKLQERRGELIDRVRATALVFRLARDERDTWLNWPARVAALMAVELGVAPHLVQTILDTQVRAQLAALSEIRPEF